MNIVNSSKIAKRLAVFQFALIIALFIPQQAAGRDADSSASAAPRFRPAVVYLANEERKDNSFIDSAIQGTKRAEAELGIKVTLVALGAEDNLQHSIRKIAKQGFSPIIAIGNQNVLPIQNIADGFPSTRFSVVDGLVPPLYPNVQSITFRDHEGAFLIGYISALASAEGHVGFIGGMDVPLIRNFAFGFEQGARYARKSIRIEQDMVGSTIKAWDDPAKAYSIAKKQFDKGADIVFAAAGGSTRGALNAAQVNRKLAIGVDTNQNGLYPGFVLTSLVKRVDIAVYQALSSARQDTWQPGITMLGLKEGALDYAVDEHNKSLLNEEIIEKAAIVKEQIISGIIDVKSYTVR